MRAVFAVLITGALLALAGCSDVIEISRQGAEEDGTAVAAESGENPADLGDAAAADDDSSSPTAAQDDEAQGAEPEAGPVTLAFGGDVHGEPPVADLLDQGGNPLDGVAPIFDDADLTVVNLETAVGTAGAPANKQFTFQAAPELLPALREGGVDVVTAANNHALDYGVEGLAETIELAREAGLAVVGAGDDAAEAYAPHYAEANGQTVAVVGLTRVIPVPEWAAAEDRPGMASTYEPGLPQALDAIAEADERADWVVVAVHWGQERHACPNQAQLDLARAFVEAGADVIAGHHPHVLQGVQELDGAIVAYSLGNFVWYARGEESRTTGVLTVDLPPDGEPAWALEPARIDDTGSPQPLADDDPAAADDIARMVADRSPGGAACADTAWPQLDSP